MPNAKTAAKPAAKRAAKPKAPTRISLNRDELATMLCVEFNHHSASPADAATCYDRFSDLNQAGDLIARYGA